MIPFVFTVNSEVYCSDIAVETKVPTILIRFPAASLAIRDKLVVVLGVDFHGSDYSLQLHTLNRHHCRNGPEWVLFIPQPTESCGSVACTCSCGHMSDWSCVRQQDRHCPAISPKAPDAVWRLLGSYVVDVAVDWMHSPIAPIQVCRCNTTVRKRTVNCIPIKSIPYLWRVAVGLVLKSAT